MSQHCKKVKGGCSSKWWWHAEDILMQLELYGAEFLSLFLCRLVSLRACWMRHSSTGRTWVSRYLVLTLICLWTRQDRKEADVLPWESRKEQADRTGHIGRECGGDGKQQKLTRPLHCRNNWGHLGLKYRDAPEIPGQTHGALLTKWTLLSQSVSSAWINELLEMWILFKYPQNNKGLLWRGPFIELASHLHIIVTYSKMTEVASNLVPGFH